MKCDKIITRYLELDDYTILPLLIRVHLLFCKKCQEELFIFEEVLAELKQFDPFLMSEDLTDQTMHKIKLKHIPHERLISNFNWLSAGLIILASLILISYSESLIWLKGHLGKNLEVPLNIVLGIIITVYFTLFIITHQKKFKKGLEIIKRINI